MALGATHYELRPDVQRVLQLTLSAFPRLTGNTYIDHPWPGWDHLSFDLWDEGGRGDPIPSHLAWASARFLLRQPGRPLIRHLIVEHSIWTSWSGWTWYSPRDHVGRVLHTHVTYWPGKPGSSP